jgi:hypothetical protein
LQSNDVTIAISPVCANVGSAMISMVSTNYQSYTAPANAAALSRFVLAGLPLRTLDLFTPVFTPARFLAPFWTRNFQQVTAPQAQMQFAADCCPLYPRKQTFGAALSPTHRNRFL